LWTLSITTPRESPTLGHSHDPEKAAFGGGILFGYMAGTIKICGDIISPIDDLEWTADAENI